MKEFIYTITDPEGIHARPAGLLVKIANSYPCHIFLEKGEKKGDAKRIFNVMGMGIKKGDEIVVRAEGQQEEEAIEALETFLKEHL